MRPLNITILLFLFFVQSGLSQDPSRIAVLDNYIEESVNNGIIPGGVFQINLHGQTIFNKTIGYVDIDKSRLYKEDDIFRIASMTKAITSVAIMQLYENGQLLIDDPVSKFIPEFKDTKVLDTFDDTDSSYTVKDLDRPITIRHLLTHTSGIYYGLFMNGKERAVSIKNNSTEYGLSHKTKSTAEMVRHIATLPLAHQPGTAWTYGINMEVLGHIVEVVSGQTLEDYFNEHIFEPLKMNDSHFYIPESKKSRLVPVYAHTRDGIKMDEDENLNYPITGFKNHFAGGGELSSTAPDYMRFVRALVNGGTLDGRRILGRKTIEYMSAPQTVHLRPEPNNHTRPNGNGFGLGFLVETEESLGAVPYSPGSYMWGGYFNTKFYIDPQEQLVFVGMTQVAPFRNGAFWDKLNAIIYSILDNNYKSPASEEESLVMATLLDYVEGIYEVDSTRIERSVHPELRKRGYWYSEKAAAYRDNLDMSFDQLRHLSATWNKNGKSANVHSPKFIEIYDVNDKTATAKLTAEWGVDYFHLAKLKGKWYIMNVIWQSIKE